MGLDKNLPVSLLISRLADIHMKDNPNF